MLSREDFKVLVQLAPLVAIDLILRDPSGHILVGRRNNPPAQGSWFVPGGRIRKNETRQAAFTRILQDETGLRLPFSQAQLLGSYDHIYTENHFGTSDFGAHYVVLGYALALPVRPELQLDRQHDGFCWISPEELLASPLVHQNTKAYFLPPRTKLNSAKTGKAGRIRPCWRHTSRMPSEYPARTRSRRSSPGRPFCRHP